MGAKPFKRKTRERLRNKRKKFQKSSAVAVFSKNSKGENTERFSEESDKLKSLKRKKINDLSEDSDGSVMQSENVPKKKKHKKTQSFDGARKQQLLEANEEEDKTIKRLETLLKLKKKKKKKLPSVFHDDGLDYLLEVIDAKDGKAAILSEDDYGMEEDFAAVKGEPIKEKSKSKLASRSQQRQRTLAELLREKEGNANSAEESGGENYEEGKEESDGENFGEYKESDDDNYGQEDESDSENYEQEEESDGENCGKGENFGSDSDDGSESNDANKHFAESENEEKTADQSPEKEQKKPKIWEDIYGRFRDESGNVIKNVEASENLYVPPKLRRENAAPDEVENEKCMKIKRQLKGLLNRLGESNLQNICHQIEGMYMKHSRNDMNKTIFSLMSELSFTAVLTPPRLIMEQAMLVALLHANIGPEIGAYFLQHIVGKVGELFKSSNNYGDGKECNNLLIFLSHLYNFKVTHSTLIFDVFHILVESFNSKDIELIQLLLKNVGFVLRKDDPLKLKELVFAVQTKATAFNNDLNDSRVRFMLDTLMAIRNNNMYKIPDYDPSIMEHSKKFLRGLIRKGCSIQELAISYEDLLKVEERGRWWIVGSAWMESDNTTSKNSQPVKGNQILPKAEVSEKILELARKQHMNTDIRKSVFCIIMTAEDYMDAFEKLVKLNLKNQQEREIIHVLLHCVLQEKKFNPYYAHLAKRFCSFARKHQMCLQFALWDKFKIFNEMKPHQIDNLSQLLSILFVSGALPLSVLKVIHFSDMDKTMVRFFRKILLAVLLDENEEACVRAFTRIAKADNLKLLRESLRLFMRHFILRNQSKLEAEVASKLEARVELAEQIMNSFKKRII